MKDEQQIRFGGEGDQEPGLEPGDIIIVLDEKPHNKYKRSGYGEFNLSSLCQTIVPVVQNVVTFWLPFLLVKKSEEFVK